MRAITSRKEAGTPVGDMFPSLRGRDAVELHSAIRPTPDSRVATSSSSPRRTAWRWRRRASSSAPASRSSISPPISGSRTRPSSSAGTRCRTRARICSPNRSTACRRCNREAIRKARIVGNPGCYPTAMQLGFLPLVEAGVVDAEHLIADCKSGVSGAGRKAELGLLFAEASDNFKAYGVERPSPPSRDRAGAERRAARRR